MEILHLINEADAKAQFINVDLSDLETRNSLVLKTPTTTLPFLETDDGNISQSNAIEYYLCAKYKPELLGNSPFEKAKVNQWIEFASCEINRSVKAIIYPKFGWAPYSKEKFDKESENIKNYIKILDNNFKNNSYIIGEKMTLADIILFRNLRFLMMLHFPEGMRKSIFPLTTKWFEKIMNNKETIKALEELSFAKHLLKPLLEKLKEIFHWYKNKKKMSKIK